MANVLIIDNQAWVMELCKEGLSGTGHKVSATDDVESVRKNVLSFGPNLVLLNQYLKHGLLVWDVLRDIKVQDQNLPVLIVTAHDTYLSSSHLSQADGYLVKSQTAADELRQKVFALLSQTLAVSEDSESS